LWIDAATTLSIADPSEFRADFQTFACSVVPQKYTVSLEALCMALTPETDYDTWEDNFVDKLWATRKARPDVEPPGMAIDCSHSIRKI
jgi:hypothetical protein